MRYSFLKSGPDPIDEQEFNTLLIALLSKLNQSNLHSIDKYPYKNIAITGLFWFPHDLSVHKCIVRYGLG